MSIRFVILGEPASKANSRKLATHPTTGKPMFIKSEKALTYRESALLQIPPACRVRMQGDVAIELHIFYASERPDLDESLILDCLQDQYTTIGGQRVICQKGVYCNDRQVREKHIFHAIDKRNPRTEVSVTEREASNG